MNNFLPTEIFSTPMIKLLAENSKNVNFAVGNLKDRESGIAYFVTNNINFYRGSSREYAGLELEGEYFSKVDTGIIKKPHIELKGKILKENSKNLLYCLSQIGNGLKTEKWLLSEVLSLKNSLNNISVLKDNYIEINLESHRKQLIKELNQLNNFIKENWISFSEILLLNHNLVNDIIEKGYNRETIKKYSATLSEKFDRINISGYLYSKNKEETYRRLLIWETYDREENLIFVTITPRITFNSLFLDQKFIPENEATLSIFIRYILLSEIVKNNMINYNYTSELKNVKPIAYIEGFFKILKPKTNQKLPQASLNSGSKFVIEMGDAETAWSVLNEWCKNKYKITVSKRSYLDSFNKIESSLLKNMKPLQVDVDNILPLCWSSNKEVLRITYVIK